MAFSLSLILEVSVNIRLIPFATSSVLFLTHSQNLHSSSLKTYDIKSLPPIPFSLFWSFADIQVTISSHKDISMSLNGITSLIVI